MCPGCLDLVLILRESHTVGLAEPHPGNWLTGHKQSFTDTLPPTKDAFCPEVAHSLQGPASLFPWNLEGQILW